MKDSAMVWKIVLKSTWTHNEVLLRAYIAGFAERLYPKLIFVLKLSLYFKIIRGCIFFLSMQNDNASM